MPWAVPKTGKIFPHGIDFEEDERMRTYDPVITKSP